MCEKNCVYESQTTDMSYCSIFISYSTRPLKFTGAFWKLTARWELEAVVLVPALIFPTWDLFCCLAPPTGSCGDVSLSPMYVGWGMEEWGLCHNKPSPGSRSTSGHPVIECSCICQTSVVWSTWIAMGQSHFTSDILLAIIVCLKGRRTFLCWKSS